MTWSYVLSDIGTSKKDQVRLLIGDTLASQPQLQDEEINYFVLARGSVYGAAAEACRTLAAMFGRSVDRRAGDTELKFSQLAAAYTKKAIEFESKSATSGSGGGLPYAGGISEMDKNNQVNDDDRVQPQFTLGQDDNFLPVPPGPTTTDFGNGTT